MRGGQDGNKQQMKLTVIATCRSLQRNQADDKRRRLPDLLLLSMIP